MLPEQMRDFGRGIIAVSFFVSNFFLWRQSGYFAGAAEENPILHTWSLAVEEQFYLAFPILLWLFWRENQRLTLIFIILVVVLSFFASEVGSWVAPNANFYLPISRAWELLAGVLCAFYLRGSTNNGHGALSAIGLLLILLAIFAFDRETPFPGRYALLPVLGTVLVITCAAPSTWVNRILSTKPLVWIGLISYSSYLWHQPLFAFSRIGPFHGLGHFEMLLLSVLALGFGALSWRYIERPFRKPRALSNCGNRIFLSVSISLLLIFGFLSVLRDGFINERFEESMVEALSVTLEDNSAYVVERFYEQEGPGSWDDQEIRQKVVLLGDSFSQDVVNMLYEGGLADLYALKVHHVSAYCGNLFVPFKEKLSFLPEGRYFECKRSAIFENPDIRKAIVGADEVWLASSWRKWHVELMKISLDNLSKITSARLVVFSRKDFPKLRASDISSFSGKLLGRLLLPLSKERSSVNASLKEASGHHLFIDLQALGCGAPPEVCAPFTIGGELKSYDGVHLTPVGARYLGNGLGLRLGLRSTLEPKG